jgi:hypothetical protein
MFEHANDKVRFHGRHDFLRLLQNTEGKLGEESPQCRKSANAMPAHRAWIQLGFSKK